MTAVALARRPERPELSLFDEPQGGEEPTLEALVSGVWGELASGRVVSCPWCGGEMRPRYGAHRRPVAGRCQSCGTTLT